MEPGTRTGCPTLRNSSGRSAWPAGSARVAPLRCTQSVRRRPSTSWDSILARLCDTSYTRRRSRSPSRAPNASRTAALIT